MRRALAGLALLALYPVVAQAQEWETVERWSGTGQMETAAFSADDREWRIDWEASPANDAGGVFQIYVYRADGTLVSVAANAAEGGKQVTHVHADPGRFYLTMNAANMEWTVEVEERSSPASESPPDSADLRHGTEFISLSREFGASARRIRAFHIDSMDYQAGGGRTLNVEYPARDAVGCRLAAAGWLTSVTRLVTENDEGYGEWTGEVACPSHRIDLRAVVRRDSTRWWLRQFDGDGNLIYETSN